VDPTSALQGKTATGGRLNVHHAIANCAPPPPDFSIAATPGSAKVRRGGTATYTVTVTPLGAFTGSVSFTLTGQPDGVSGTFDPTSVTGSGASKLTVTVASSAAPGTYTLTITGTGGDKVHSTQVKLQVRR
jgi:archaellum component FlaG (FlaF/FlaG flagellin family)